MTAPTAVEASPKAASAVAADAPAPRPEKPSGLAGDLWGGLAAALVALPSAIAYGVITFAPVGPEYAGYGALAGIVGAVAMGLIAPAFGGAPRLISVPCAPAAAVMGALGATLVASGAGPERVLILMTLVGLLTGTFQLLFGALRGGKLIKFIPYPVVSGYLSGVGLTIILSQLPKLFAYPKGTPLWAGLAAPGSWEWHSVVIGAATMAMMAGGARLTKKVPGAILGLLAGLAAYLALGLRDPAILELAHNKLVIGPIASAGGLFTSIAARWGGLGALRLADLLTLLAPALTLSVLLSIDTLKTCVVLDALTRTRHDSNRELVGQGLGNLASAALGGMPGAGAAGPTLVNLQSGGTTRLSGVMEGAFVLTAFLALSGFIGWIPIGALAGILLVVGFRMVDPHTLMLLKQKETLLDFLVIAAVVGTAIGVGLLEASGVGLALSILLFIRDQIRGSVIRRKVYGDRIRSKQRRLPAENAVLDRLGAGIVVCELQGNLFFGTTDQLLGQVEADLKRCRFLILDMRRVQSVDFTGAHILEQLGAMLAEKGGVLLFSDLPTALPTGQDLKTYFERLGVFGDRGSAQVFGEQSEALQWAEDGLLDQEKARAARTERPLELHELELLKGCSADSFAELHPLMKEKTFESGQAVCRQGEKADEIFFIRRGGVKILLELQGGKTLHIATFSQGDVFGDLAFLVPGVRSADAIAEGATELYVLSRRDFDTFSAAHPRTTVQVFRRLAETLALRLRSTDAELSALRES